MARKWILAAIWLSFVGYTLWLAPLDRSYTWSLARKLLTLQWNDLNAYIPAIFSLMGIWPMIYACMMFADGRSQNFRVWPYFIGANFTGVLCLLPYLIVRQPNAQFYGSKDKWLAMLDRRSTGIVLLLSTIGIFAYALIAGDWSDYVAQFQTRHFVHLISIDFLLMCLTFPITTLWQNDMARRGFHHPKLAWEIATIPLFGPLYYLCIRPPLRENSASQPTQATQRPISSANR
ncbi:hypothetical protein ACQ4M4_06085 [Leptolyngbya sp. AN02str]|uniref:hypothetical protein n=1 Tax=Leptolyngbya sp. AN02str TaxID=3423363 RepID=UPI003D317AAA